MPKPNKASKDSEKEKDKVKPAKVKSEGVKAQVERPAVKSAPKVRVPRVKVPKPAPETAAEALSPAALDGAVPAAEIEGEVPAVAAEAGVAEPEAAPAAEEPIGSIEPRMPVLQSPMGGRRFKPVKPPLPAGTLEISIARAKYTVRHLTGAIEVERPRKRDPKNPRVYKFSLKGCETARKHLSGRSVTLADAAELLKAVKVTELETLEGEARRQATKFLLVALSSRNEAELTRDGDLILVRVPFNAADLA
jgi:hypothetical protein